MLKRTFFNVLGLVFIISSCSKNLNNVEKDTSLNTGGRLDIYLLESFETVNEGLKINITTAIISSEKVISYEDINSYNKSNHTFNVAQPIIDNLQQNAYKYFRKAFAVTIDSEIIYTGYFWYGFASSICNWITIDPLSSLGTKNLRVDLSYPGDSFGDASSDNRNNTRIINLLQKDNKLINQ